MFATVNVTRPLPPRRPHERRDGPARRRVTFVGADKDHALRVAAELRHIADAEADDDTVGGDQHNFLIRLHHQRADKIAVFAREADRANAFTATVCYAVFRKRRALAESFVGDDKQVEIVIGRHFHRHNFVAAVEAHADDAAGRTAHRAHVTFIETDRLAVRRNEDNLTFAIGKADADQFVTVREPDGNEPTSADVCIVREGSLLDVP